MSLISCVIAVDTNSHKNELANWLSRISTTYNVIECVKLEKIVEVAMRVYPELILVALSETEQPYKIIQSIKEVCPQTTIVVVTEKENTEMIIKSLKAGADACLGQVVPGYLSRILELVCRSSVLIAPRFIKNYLVQKENVYKKEVSVMPYNLTNREKQIFDLLKKNYTNKKIADFLYISESTVKTHVSNVFRKAGAKNRIAFWGKYTSRCIISIYLTNIVLIFYQL